MGSRRVTVILIPKHDFDMERRRTGDRHRIKRVSEESRSSQALQYIGSNTIIRREMK